MSKKHYDSVIRLGIIDKIETKPDKSYNRHPKNKYKKITEKSISYGILIEKRFPKVKTDENKLFGTKPNHKYY